MITSLNVSILASPIITQVDPQTTSSGQEITLSGSGFVENLTPGSVMTGFAKVLDDYPTSSTHGSEVLELSSGKYLVSGYFPTLGVGYGMVRLNSDGTLDNTFTTSNGPLIRNFAEQSDGKIIIVGGFNDFAGVERRKIARLNQDGTLDTSFNPGNGANSDIRNLWIRSDGKILIRGSFTNYAGVNTRYLALVNSDGTLDTGFNTINGANLTIEDVFLKSDNSVLIAGNFTTYKGQNINRLALLDANGNLNSSFSTNIGSGVNGIVKKIIPQTDGKFLIVGTFSTVNGIAYNNLARINSDGTVDTTFNIGTGFDQEVFGAIVLPDNKILAYGKFNNVNGVQSGKIAKLNSDGSVDSSFNPGGGFDRNVYIASVVGDKYFVAGEMQRYNGVTVPQMILLNSDATVANYYNGASLQDNYYSNGQLGLDDSRNIFESIINSEGDIIAWGKFNYMFGLHFPYGMFKINTSEKNINIKIGNQDCQNVTFISDISLKCIIPENITSGLSSVKVTNPNGEQFTLAESLNISNSSGSRSCNNSLDGVCTDLNLEVLPGSLQIIAPTTLNLDQTDPNGITQETPLVIDPIQISNVDQPVVAFFSDSEFQSGNQASAPSIVIQDLRGSQSGYDLNVKFTNLVAADDPEKVILLGNQLDTDITTPYSGRKFLNFNFFNLRKAAQKGDSVENLSYQNAPLFNSLDGFNRENGTNSINILSAQAGEGASIYKFDLQIDLTIPAFGFYPESGKIIREGNYSGQIIFDLV